MLQKVNRVIMTFIYWDLFINSAWGMLGPIFAIFILQRIAVGNIVEGTQTAGFGILFYWVTKAVLQIPIGNYLDQNHGEIDDFWFFLIGTIIVSFVPFGYLFSTQPLHIFILEILHGIGMAMVIPSSSAIFIRHVDKGKEAYETSLDSTFSSVGVGIAGALGGLLASYIGFSLIFILTGVLTLISAVCIMSVRSQMLPRVPKNVQRFPIEKPF